MINFFSDRFTTLSNYFSTQQLPGVEVFKNYFSWSFWTEGYLFPISEYAMVSLAAVVLFLIILILWRRRLKKLQRTAPVYDLPVTQLTNIIILIIIMSPLYAFFRAQQVSYVSSRLVVLTTLLIIFAWLVWITIYLKRIVPVKRKVYLEKERFFRYLPKK